MFRDARQALACAVVFFEILINFVQLVLTWLLIVAECLWERLYYYGLPPGSWALLVSALIVLRVHEAVEEKLGTFKLGTSQHTRARARDGWHGVVGE